jgi:hypothetical protein
MTEYRNSRSHAQPMFPQRFLNEFLQMLGCLPSVSNMLLKTLQSPLQAHHGIPAVEILNSA